MTSKVRVRMLSLAAVLLAATTVPAAARLHTKLTKSNPAADATLKVAPKTIELWWNEKPEVALDHHGAGRRQRQRRAGKLRSSSDLMGVAADVTGALVPGAYVVKWKTAGKDGHAVRGAFNFTISK